MSEIMLYSGERTLEELEFVAACGFTSICFHGVQASEEWATTFQRTQALGMAAWMVFPDWPRLGLCGNDSALRTAFGDSSAMQGDENCLGPSYWHPEADAIAINDLRWLLSLSSDGVVVSPRYGDTPYPATWRNIHLDGYRHCRKFWCWDTWAQAAWATQSDQPMMELAAVDAYGRPAVDPKFYEWYKAAPVGRINRLTDAVLDGGVKQVATWLVPFTYWTGETMAMGTAGALPLLERWYRRVAQSGARALMIAACLFAHTPFVRGTVIEAARQLHQMHHWEWLAGAEACTDGDRAIINVQRHRAMQDDVGLSGFFVSDYNMAKPSRYDVYPLLRGVK